MNSQSPFPFSPGQMIQLTTRETNSSLGTSLSLSLSLRTFHPHVLSLSSHPCFFFIFWWFILFFRFSFHSNWNSKVKSQEEIPLGDVRPTWHFLVTSIKWHSLLLAFYSISFLPFSLPYFSFFALLLLFSLTLNLRKLFTLHRVYLCYEHKL